MSELKPCPFCPPDRSDPEVHSYKPFSFGKRPINYLVECSGCGTVMTGAPEHEFRSEKDAIAAWNARHGRACRIENVLDRRDREGRRFQTVILSCGHERTVKFGERFSYCDQCGAKVV